MDDADNHETECALRETAEEIGLKSEFIDVSEMTNVCLSKETDNDLILDLGRRFANYSTKWTINRSSNRTS